MPETTSCPSCGSALSADDAFCGQCGRKVSEPDHTALRRRREHRTGASGFQTQCPSCNAPLHHDDAYCADCGARKTSTGERVGAPADHTWRQLREKLVAATEGEFDVLQELGRGGMGAVYLARERSLERLVAIKVLLPHLLTQPTLLERFRNEARIVAALRHPAIVNIYTVRHDDELHYFVMDYIEGASLQQVIRGFGPVSIDMTRVILHQVGSALAFAHRQGRGVIHRDVKPSNIMLDADGSTVVMDFGISKVMTTSSGLTQTGMVVGTPEYMSPEQCRSDSLSPASDQYALGLVAYAMLTGSPPFAGPHYAVLYAQTQDEPPPLSEVRPDCPPELADAIHRMLAKDPGDRWPDVRAAVKAAGARAAEHGDPVREAIGELVQDIVGDTTVHVPVADLAVTPPPVEQLFPGDEVILEATPMDHLGKELRGRELRWYSTDPRVAAVREDGSVVLQGEGSARIVAECEGRRREVPISVARPPVASIRVEVERRSLTTGERQSAQAVPEDPRGRPLEDRAVEWVSSDATVVSVSEDGVLEAVGPGSAEISVRCEGLDDSVSIDVRPAAPAAATGDRPSEGGAPAGPPPDRAGASEEAVEDVEDEDDDLGGAVAAADEAAVEAREPEDSDAGSASAGAAATPGSSGPETVELVTPPESVAIRTDGKEEPEATKSLQELPLLVALREVASSLPQSARWVALFALVFVGGLAVALRPWGPDSSAPTLTGDIETQLVPGLTYALDELVGDRLVAPSGDAMTAGDVTWALADPSYSGQVYLDPMEGRIAVRHGFSGPLVLEAYVGDGSTLRIPLEVAEGTSSGVTLGLTASDDRPEPGQRVALAADLRDARGNPLPESWIDWSLAEGSEEVADMVGDRTLLARSPGVVVVRASTPGGADSLTLTVVEPSGAGSGEVAQQDTPADDTPAPRPAPEPSTTPEEVVPPRPAELRIEGDRTALREGQARVLSVTVLDQDGNALEDDAAPAWRSTDPAVASVSPTGRVSAERGGSAWIVASVAGVRDSVLVEVAPVVASVEISGAPESLEVGDPGSVSARALDDEGRVLGIPVRWRSSNPQVARVDAESGALRAAGTGRATVTATAGGEEASFTLEVAAPPPTMPTDAEAASAADRCASAVTAGDRERLATLVTPAPDGSPAEKLLDYASNSGRHLEVRERRPVEGLAATDDGAVFRFATILHWRDNFGGGHDATVTFEAAVAPAGGGWQLTYCRPVTEF